MKFPYCQQMSSNRLKLIQMGLGLKRHKGAQMSQMSSNGLKQTQLGLNEPKYVDSNVLKTFWFDKIESYQK